MILFFFSSRRRHTRCGRDWSSDVCSSDLRRVRIEWSVSVSAATCRGRRGSWGWPSKVEAANLVGPRCSVNRQVIQGSCRETEGKVLPDQRLRSPIRGYVDGIGLSGNIYIHLEVVQSASAVGDDRSCLIRAAVARVNVSGGIEADDGRQAGISSLRSIGESNYGVDIVRRSRG